MCIVTPVSLRDPLTTYRYDVRITLPLRLLVGPYSNFDSHDYDPVVASYWGLNLGFYDRVMRN